MPLGRRKAPVDLGQRRVPIAMYDLVADSMPAAHYELGLRVKEPAWGTMAARVAATPPTKLWRQLAESRMSREALLRRAENRSVAALIRAAIQEYLECLSAWAQGVGVPSRLPELARLARDRITSDELALWAQHDNTGCQTGLLRMAGAPDAAGAIMFWHTEEDTIGYMDKPRVATFIVRDLRLSTFLYPYLLPGPAFGWQANQVHAVDSLNVQGTPGGTISSVVSWLVWRLGCQVDAAQIINALSPHADGCAIHVVQVQKDQAVGWSHEFGGAALHSRRLAEDSGALAFQVNTVTSPDSELGRTELLTPPQRARYERRIARTNELLGRASQGRRGTTPQGILEMLTDRRGGSYGYANLDVFAHCIGRASAAGIELYLQSGSAMRGDQYKPQWPQT